MAVMVMSAFLMAAFVSGSSAAIRRVFRACNDEALPGHWEGLLFRTG